MNKNIIIGCLGVLLLLLVAVTLYMRHGNDERISELETEIDALRKHEKQSEVDRRVSQQMEEIAYGQQVLSEERSKEAIRQSEIAQEMTLRSESERKKAIEAQGIAEESAQEARNAYQMAEHQRDKELGNMLAYASYLYTKNYGGDLYTPAVFQALIQSAGGRRNWNVHNGSISRIGISAKNNQLLTVSSYGEIFVHQFQDGQLRTTRLMNDQNYCFRDVFAAKDGKEYAVSHTGHLVVFNGKTVNQILYLENIDRPFSIQNVNDSKQLLIIGENSIALLDIATDKIIGTRRLDFRVMSVGRRDYKPLLFDNRGRMHLFNGLDDITNEKVPVSGQVTAFASSKNEHLTAYGMADGTIWLIDKNGKSFKLVGHLSQVTKMKLNGKRLYSSSYDGKLLFWVTDDPQIKPITLFQSSSWLTDFTFSSTKDYIWTGEHNGTMTEYLISLPKIAQRLRQNVKRNFTKEEWNYYVGKGIPYREVKVNSEQ